MKLLFLLSKENINLSREEALAIAKTEGVLTDSMLVLDSRRDIEDFKRLAFTKKIYQFLFSCEKKDLIKKIKSFDWNSIYEENFCLRIYGDKKLKEFKYADILWDLIKNPKANLEHPKTLIEFNIIKDKIFAGKLLWENEENFSYRETKNRPEHHPTTMHPKLARACINLTGVEKGTLLDPFCGSGGILIEAGLLGYNIVGYDIDESLIRRAKINLNYYKVKKYKLEYRDSTKRMVKSDLIVTDVPYGKSSKVNNIKKTYSDFLNLSYTKTKKMVVIFPSFVNYKKLLGKWKIKKTFDIYVHRSLTRKVVILVK
jgi:tRNA (guanine10-N2)-dimethyltransferase